VSDVRIDGTVDPGWGAVADAFARNFTDHGDVGAACAVYVDGRAVVDLWGGLADRAANRPWCNDTLCLTFSTTKGVTAVVCNRLVQEGLDLPHEALDPGAEALDPFAAGTRERGCQHGRGCGRWIHGRRPFRASGALGKSLPLVREGASFSQGRLSYHHATGPTNAAAREGQRRVIGTGSFTARFRTRMARGFPSP